MPSEGANDGKVHGGTVRKWIDQDCDDAVVDVI